LSDFGVSKVLALTLQNAYTKETGTIGYMPPEIADSKTHMNYDPFASDIFSLGIMMIEMLDGDDPQRSLKEIVEGKTSDIPKELKTKYPKISKLAKKCCAPLPHKRITVEQLKESLQNWHLV